MLRQCAYSSWAQQRWTEFIIRQISNVSYHLLPFLLSTEICLTNDFNPNIVLLCLCNSHIFSSSFLYFWCCWIYTHCYQINIMNIMLLWFRFDMFSVGSIEYMRNRQTNQIRNKKNMVNAIKLSTVHHYKMDNDDNTWMCMLLWLLVCVCVCVMPHFAYIHLYEHNSRTNNI